MDHREYKRLYRSYMKNLLKQRKTTDRKMWNLSISEISHEEFEITASTTVKEYFDYTESDYLQGHWLRYIDRDNFLLYYGFLSSPICLCMDKFQELTDYHTNSFSDTHYWFEPVNSTDGSMTMKSKAIISNENTINVAFNTAKRIAKELESSFNDVFKTSLAGKDIPDTIIFNDIDVSRMYDYCTTFIFTTPQAMNISFLDLVSTKRSDKEPKDHCPQISYNYEIIEKITDDIANEFFKKYYNEFINELSRSALDVTGVDTDISASEIINDIKRYRAGRGIEKES